MKVNFLLAVQNMTEWNDPYLVVPEQMGDVLMSSDFEETQDIVAPEFYYHCLYNVGLAFGCNRGYFENKEAAAVVDFDTFARVVGSARIAAAAGDLAAEGFAHTFVVGFDDNSAAPKLLQPYNIE